MRCGSGNYSCPFSLSSKIPFHSPSLIQMPSSKAYTGSESLSYHVFGLLPSVSLYLRPIQIAPTLSDESRALAGTVLYIQALAAKLLNIIAAKFGSVGKFVK